jgi:hypothetical protein
LRQAFLLLLLPQLLLFLSLFDRWRAMLVLLLWCLWLWLWWLWLLLLVLLASLHGCFLQ